MILEFHNDSVIMGFSAPDLGVRTDIPPGKVTRLRIVPEKLEFTYRATGTTE